MATSQEDSQDSLWIQKNIKLDGKQVNDTELVYTLVICLQ